MGQWAKQFSSLQTAFTVFEEARGICAKTLPNGPVELVLRRPKRSNRQNDMLWPLCRDFEKQATLFGQKLDAEGWKIVLSDAYEGETQYIPKLNGKGMISRAPKTSEYPKDTFSGLIEFILAEGANRGVQWSKESEDVFKEVRG